MPSLFDSKSRSDITFLRLMVCVLFLPFFLLADASLPASTYYIAGLILIYAAVLFLFPRINKTLNIILPLSTIIDIFLITCFIYLNDKYIYVLSYLYVLPVIALAFDKKPATPFWGALGVGLLYFSLGIIKKCPLIYIIIPVVFFFIIALFTDFLVQAIQQIYYRQANQDAITKIYNRRYFNHFLAKLVHDQTPFSLILLDLDNFKSLNDTQGHHHGDYVLKVVASILKECTRSYDTVARFGGDEFAIMLPNSTKETGRNIANRIRNDVLVNPRLLSYPNISLSQGIASFPHDASSEEEILQRADEALYKAKKMGKNNVYVCKKD